MAILTEGKWPLEFLESEAPGYRSRDNVTVLSGQNLDTGAVIGFARYGIGRAVATSVSGTGNGTMTLGTPHVGADAQVGTYTIKCITKAANSGTFSVTCPDGTRLANATVGTLFESTHVRFTLNDGSTDFEVDDTFTIVVSTSAPAAVGTGNGTIGSLTLGRAAMPGLYEFKCTVAGTNAATFELRSPSGAIIERAALSGSGATATFATNPQIGAVITDGGTDFAVGDIFSVVVHNLLVPKAAAWSPRPTTFDGRQVAAGVLLTAVDATSADAPGVCIARDAEVKAGKLSWLAAHGAADKAAALKQLAALGIKTL